MLRRRYGLGGLGAVAAIGVWLLAMPLTSATSAPFLATPSYAPYGGLHFVGSAVTSASGTGSSTIVKAPTFFVLTGVEKQSQRSSASGMGNYGIRLWSGVQNVSFDCPATCVSGSHTVTINWTLSWTANVSTSCPGTASHPTRLAAVQLFLIGFVFDESTSPATVVGSVGIMLYHHVLTSAGSASGSKVKHTYLLGFTATLTSGNPYTVESFVLASTHAEAVSPAGAICASSAAASSGTTALSKLNAIAVA